MSAVWALQTLSAVQTKAALRVYLRRQDKEEYRDAELSHIINFYWEFRYR